MQSSHFAAKDDFVHFSFESTDALKDLNLAVDLSKGRGKAGIQALCQRGVLHRCVGRTDEARDDFELAARGGSSFARTQLVALNPYAAMCNAMLRDLSAKSSKPWNISSILKKQYKFIVVGLF